MSRVHPPRAALDNRPLPSKIGSWRPSLIRGVVSGDFDAGDPQPPIGVRHELVQKLADVVNPFGEHAPIAELVHDNEENVRSAIHSLTPLGFAPIFSTLIAVSPELSRWVVSFCYAR